MTPFTRLTPLVVATGLCLATAPVFAQSPDILPIYEWREDGLFKTSTGVERGAANSIARARIVAEFPNAVKLVDIKAAVINKRYDSHDTNKVTFSSFTPAELAQTLGLPLHDENTFYPNLEDVDLDPDDLVFTEDEGRAEEPDDLVFSDDEAVPDDLEFSENDIKETNDDDFDFTEEEVERADLAAASGLMDGTWKSSVDTIIVSGCPKTLEPAVRAQAHKAVTTKSIMFSLPDWHPNDFGFGAGSWVPEGNDRFSGVMEQTQTEGSPIGILVTMNLEKLAETRVAVASTIRIHVAKEFAAVLGGTDKCRTDVTGFYSRVSD